MELRQLHYFRAIAEEEHFGRASTRLHIAQPALSRQVRLLEEELGVSLFERLPRGVRLTAAGRVLLRRCQRLSAEIDDIVAETRAAAAGSVGLLRLGFIEVSAWQGIVPETIRAFRTEFPKVELALSAMPTLAQLVALKDKRIDLGYLYNPPDDPDLASLPLLRHEVVLAVPSHAPYALARELPLEALRGENFIGFRRQVSIRYFDDLAAAFKARGFEPKIVAEMESEPDMLALVNAGAGLAFVNSCQRWRQPAGIRFVRVPELDVGLELALVSRRDNATPALAHFIALASRLVALEGATRNDESVLPR